MRAWADARRLLAVRLDTIGDVLMMTPALRALAGSAPGRRITLLTSTRGAAITPLIPEVDEVLVYDPPWMKATAGPDPERDAAVIARLTGAFDGGVVFTTYSQSPLPAALLLHLARVPLRLAHCRENPYHLLTDWVPDPEPDELLRHEVRRQLDLVATVGAATEDERLSLRVPASAARRVERLLREHDVGAGTPLIVLHPGASAPSRRYRPEGFAEIARRLALEGLTVVFTGDGSELGLIEDIRVKARRPTLSFAGELSLAELAALLRRASVVVSNNTAPAHMAAAVGTPVVDLYALTNPQHAPWGVESRVLYHDVPCRYCMKSVCPQKHHHCLKLVEPAQAVAAVHELLPALQRLSA